MFSKLEEKVKLAKKRCACTVKMLQFLFSMKLTLSLIASAASLITFNSCDSKSSVDQKTEEKILVIGNSSEPSGLDPQTVTGVIESNIIRGLFEGLCMDDPTDPNKHSPGAAASWSSNAEFTEWTFNLHKGGKWSDGTPLTTHDFLFAYNRLLHPKFGAKYSSMLYFIRGAEDYNKNKRHKFLLMNLPEWERIKDENYDGNSDLDDEKYLREFFVDLEAHEKRYDLSAKGLNHLTLEQYEAINRDRSLFNWSDELSFDDQTLILSTYIQNEGKDLWNIANVGIRAEDDYTLKVSLKAPTPFLPDITKHYTWYPVPRHVLLKLKDPYKKEYTWTEPGSLVSNGPFKLKEWKFNDFIELETNTNYWDTHNVKLKGLKFLPISNAYTESRMFFDDQLHTTYTLASEQIEYARSVKPEVVRQETYLGTNFLRLNNKLPEFEDHNLRKALAYSIDTKSIIDNVIKGGQKPASGIVPPMGSYVPSDVFKYDLDLAKEYFSKTKYANNPRSLKLTMVTTDTEASKVLSEAIQSMWSQNLGINVEISQSDWKTYLGKVTKLDYGVATGGWIGDYPDPTTFLDIWKAGDGSNRTGWESEVYEAKLAEAEQTSDAALRIKILQEAEAIFLADYPIIPIFWYTSNYLLHDSVKGWNPHIMKSQPYKFMSLEK